MVRSYQVKHMMVSDAVQNFDSLFTVFEDGRIVVGRTTMYAVHLPVIFKKTGRPLPNVFVAKTEKDVEVRNLGASEPLPRVG